MKIKVKERRLAGCVVGIVTISLMLLLSRSISDNENKDILTNFNGWKNSLDDVSSNSSNINPLDIKVQTMQLPTDVYPTTVAAGRRFDLSLCKETQKVFRGTFDQNLRKLKNLKFPEAEKWIERLGLDKKRSRVIPSFPVLVTGASSGFFDISQGVIKTVHEKLMPKYPDLKFIYYGLGMNEDQKLRLQRYCRCEYRDFPDLNTLPAHVRNWKNFAFKAIIVAILFQEFGHVWWVDSSVRFTTNDLEGPLQYLKQTGSLFFTYEKILSVAQHTVITTFNYFKEHPCPYNEYGEIEAGNVAFYDNHVSRTIIRNWVSCALIKDCLAPIGSQAGCRRGGMIAGQCHRYDQSVLSIILRRLYHKQNDYPLVEKAFWIIKVMRGERVNYLPRMSKNET